MSLPQFIFTHIKQSSDKDISSMLNAENTFPATTASGITSFICVICDALGPSNSDALPQNINPISRGNLNQNQRRCDFGLIFERRGTFLR